MVNSLADIKKIGIHILFWLGYYFLTFYWFSLVYEIEVALLIGLRIVIIHLLLFYININFLLPRFVDKGHYLIYLLAIIILIAAIFYLIRFSNEWFSIRNNINFRRAGRPAFFPRLFFGRGTYISLASSMAILFISSTYWINAQGQKRKQQAIALKNENLEAEMRFLKSQTNPHFLFNALNNIYALSYTNSAKAPDMIMKLSEMLRYVLYESNEKKVPLADEIDYIKHFIDFQILKIEGVPNIKADFKISDTNIQVEPMLFIPFIENSFKHSKIGNLKQSWVRIYLSANRSTIELKVENSIPKDSFSKDQTGGIGLTNVKKRLVLLYPESHELIIKNDDTSFNVNLIITV